MGRSRTRRPAPVPLSGLPDELRTTLQPLLGDAVNDLEAALATPSPTSLRLNPAKPFAPSGTPVPWCSTGLYLDERPAFTFDPLLHAGCYYVQEASSMLLEPALRATGLLGDDIRALDLSAAPGGKSTHLRSLLTPASLLVANEVDRRRAQVLQENLWKWGGPNTVVLNDTPERLAATGISFDLVVLDAPCSGEGMFRKDPFARAQWTPGLVRQCATVQRTILPHAWDLLAPGGFLVYSTCTWEPTENEGQLVPLLEQGAEPVDPHFDAAWGVERTEVDGVISHRCYPHKVRGEGFFIAVLRKPGERSGHRLRSDGTTGLPNGIRADRPQQVVVREDVEHVVDATWGPVVEHLCRSTRVLSPGTPLWQLNGDRKDPHPALALSTLLDRTAFISVELDEAQAIAYLRGEALPARDVRGTGLVLHRGHALGWVSGAGNRWNNNWPAPWRIRAQHPQAVRVSWSMTPAHR